MDRMSRSCGDRSEVSIELDPRQCNARQLASDASKSPPSAHRHVCVTSDTSMRVVLLHRSIATTAAAAAVHYSMVSSSLTHLVHAQKRIVVAWTVDDASTAVHLMRAGVDVFVSNEAVAIDRALRDERRRVCEGDEVG